VVTWNINTTCNYRCSYCTQRFLEDRSRWLRDTPAFLAGFARLPGHWEVKISGGEPFQHPSLIAIVSGLKRLGYAISIVTNFSATCQRLTAFLDAAGTSLRVFSASLHLEYAGTAAALAAFVEKACWFIEQLPSGATVSAQGAPQGDLPQAAFNTTCVATRTNLPRLPALKAYFEARGVRFKVQPEKQNRDVIDYTPDERALLLALGGHNDLGTIAPAFRGRPCWAGALSFTLDDRGHAWRCYPARRYSAQYLGNFLDGSSATASAEGPGTAPSFRLAAGPTPCLYEYCNCTVPIERGMMPHDATRAGGG
jgi:hypothetical protein